MDVVDKAAPISVPDHASAAYEAPVRSELEASTKPPATVAVESGASVFQTASNLSSSIVGSGVLALSASLSISGSILGSLLLVMAAGITYYCFCLLSRAAEGCGQYTFKGIASGVWGRHGILPVAVVVFLSTFGFCTMYVVISGDFLYTFLVNVMETTPEFLLKNDGKLAKDVFKSVFALGIMAPLSMMRKMSGFAPFSVAALVIIIFAVGVVIYYFGVAAADGTVAEMAKQVPLAQFNFKTFMALPVFIFAYGAAPAVPPLLNEIKGRSAALMNRASGLAVVFCTACYVVIGLTGLFQFGPDVSDNVLLSLGNTVVTNMALVGFIYVVLVSYPIVIYSNYLVIYALIDYIISNKKGSGAVAVEAPAASQPPTGDTDQIVEIPSAHAPNWTISEETSTLSDATSLDRSDFDAPVANVGSEAQYDLAEPAAPVLDDVLSGNQVTKSAEPEQSVWFGWPVHCVLCWGEALVVLALAIAVPSLGTISGVIGAIGGVPMYFALPCFLYLCCRNYPWSLPKWCRKHIFTAESGYEELSPAAAASLARIQDPDPRYAPPHAYPGGFRRWAVAPQNLAPNIILILCPFILVLGVVSTVIQ